ncbi:MAG: hypothetical protein NTW62_01475 [Candidatus Nomurabacteria bacterium]|nr:hypothetical protein [Candidatus Nomurabacteria bacterium]
MKSKKIKGFIQPTVFHECFIDKKFLFKTNMIFFDLPFEIIGNVPEMFHYEMEVIDNKVLDDNVKGLVKKLFKIESLGYLAIEDTTIVVRPKKVQKVDSSESRELHNKRALFLLFKEISKVFHEHFDKKIPIPEKYYWN